MSNASRTSGRNWIQKIRVDGFGSIGGANFELSNTTNALIEERGPNKSGTIEALDALNALGNDRTTEHFAERDELDKSRGFGCETLIDPLIYLCISRELILGVIS